MVQRRMTLLLCVVAMLLQTIPGLALTSSDPWVEPLDDGSASFTSNSSSSTRVLEDGHVGKGVRAVIPAGAHHGVSARWDVDNLGLGDPDELYWRYWIRFPEGFTIRPPYRGKLPGPANTYGGGCYGGRVSTTSSPCWSARMMFSRDYRGDDGKYQDGPDDQTLLGFYTYHVDGPGHRGDILTWDDDVALLDHGKWYCVEGRIDLNTPGVNDGVLQGWVDGEEAFARDDFSWRRTGEEFLDVDDFWFNVYYGGAGVSPVTNEVHFDSFALGAERLGCSDFEGSFADDDDTVFQPDVEWMVAQGLTNGCNPPDNHRFCTDEIATRGEVAALLARALDLESVDGDTFRDDDDSVFEGAIEALVAAGITQGCAPNRFCPDHAVTRGQMAAFLHRALQGQLPVGSAQEFEDISDSVYMRDIRWLSATGVTSGCGQDLYCTNDGITRGEVAAFLRRAFTLRVIPVFPTYGGRLAHKM